MSRTSWGGPRPEWTHKQRARILRRDPVCVACGVRPSEVADHIIPVAEGGLNRVSNGQGMCTPCHDDKSEREKKRGIKRRSRRRTPEQHPGLTQ